MIDLIAHGTVLGVKDGKLWLEIPSASFVAKCEEYIHDNPDYRHSPL